MILVVTDPDSLDVWPATVVVLEEIVTVRVETGSTAVVAGPATNVETTVLMLPPGTGLTKVLMRVDGIGIAATEVAKTDDIPAVCVTVMVDPAMAVVLVGFADVTPATVSTADAGKDVALAVAETPRIPTPP